MCRVCAGRSVADIAHLTGYPGELLSPTPGSPGGAAYVWWQSFQTAIANANPAPLTTAIAAMAADFEVTPSRHQ
jgi:hypothetical protein